MIDLWALLRERVLLADAAMGSQTQLLDLDIDRDFRGCENCTEILNQSRPDLIRGIHETSLAAGSDLVQTNSFGGSPMTLAEFGLADQAFVLNKGAAELACEAVEQFSGDGRVRGVLGSIGPGTKLPSLGHVAYQDVEDAIATQAAGLIAGGVDGFIIETVQDVLQAKAAVNGARRAMAEVGRELPLIVQVTVETNGALLMGADIAAAITALHAMRVSAAGLNCATGPQEMAEHLRWLSSNWPGPIAVQPNAGLPELVEGKPHYPLSPQEMAAWLERFVEEDGVSLIGGCCGTTATHIEALNAMLMARAGGAARPAPVKRQVHWVPSVASIYQQVPLRQENAILMIGERCNANGSRKFRELQAAESWDGCVAMARDQQAEGSHCIDLCTAYVGRNETHDMSTLIEHVRGAVALPLVFDSTERDVLEAAFKLYGGKAILNSINFEDGEGPAAERLALARRFGAAVIALTIDEQGMAKDAAGKLRIAKRLHDFATREHGLASSDILIDPLTFTICTGNEDDRKLGIETLDGIEQIARALPDCQIVLGLSNISFGLKPAARHVLNSVFLDHAVKRGMNAAIVHVGKIVSLHKIPPNEVKAAEDLIFDRRAPGFDPLHAFIALFTDRKAATAKTKKRAHKIEARLAERIVDGDREGLDADLDRALKQHPPLTIINKFLLDGMKTVGELFGSGKMQLPFVLQSAETMKAAVSYLESFMDRVDGEHKGTIVLATVKGDVHDIGKNLTDIILSNNGYRVINLGIKQPIGDILSASKVHQADAIGMSGLLVKSTAIMRENLQEMTRQSLEVPVLLGGAALTRRYVEDDCVRAYQAGRVAYARDAFDGLKLMDAIVDGTFDSRLADIAQKRSKTVVRDAEFLAAPAAAASEEGAVAVAVALKGGPQTRAKPRRTEHSGQARRPGADDHVVPLRPVEGKRHILHNGDLAAVADIPAPPFWGARIIEEVPIRALLPYLNTHMLYQFHWGFKKQGRRFHEFKAWAKRELRPILERVINLCEQDHVLKPTAAYGYWPAAADGDDIVLYTPPNGAGPGAEVARFAMPRQQRPGGLCLADFLHPVGNGVRDVIGLQVVTVGQRASDVARQWFADDRYQDYLYLHGLGVEMAEAMAEFTHKRIRDELGFGHEDDRDMEKLLKQGYRGARYSFGYPACPNLHDQEQLLALLGADRVGLVLGDEDQLHPEQSTSAIVLHHPQACYFTI